MQVVKLYAPGDLSLVNGETCRQQSFVFLVATIWITEWVLEKGSRAHHTTLETMFCSLTNLQEERMASDNLRIFTQLPVDYER